MLAEPALKYDDDDLAPDDISVTGEWYDSNAYLDDPKRLRQHFEDEGYLLFCGVFYADTPARAQRRMIVVPVGRGLVYVWSP